VTGELFGYPRPDGHTRSRSWRESFLTIIDDILAVQVADIVQQRRYGAVCSGQPSAR
jgi:hypothetical protein